jgi:hypothetical protein
MQVNQQPPRVPPDRRVVIWTIEPPVIGLASVRAAYRPWQTCSCWVKKAKAWSAVGELVRSQPSIVPKSQVERTPSGRPRPLQRPSSPLACLTVQPTRHHA